MRIAREFFATTGANWLGVEIHVPAELITLADPELVRGLLEEFERQINPGWDVIVHRSMHFPFLPNSAFNLGDLNSKCRAKTEMLLEQSAQFAASLDIGVICTHLNATCTYQQWQDCYHEQVVRDRSMSYALETLRQAIPIFEATGVTLAIENIPYPFESIYHDPPISPYLGVFREELAEIFSDVPSSALSCCFDALHSNILITSARNFADGKYDFGRYWGLHSNQEAAFRQIALEGDLYLLTEFADRVSNVHLGGQQGTYTPGGTPIIEGSLLDLKDTALMEVYARDLQEIATKSQFTEISTILEVKEEDYQHATNLPTSLNNCWKLLQSI